ncbi:hypothetical protein RJ639_018469 [Escallonia herrerae]|uniref:Uncharacterized protein n=1 Tax=Escallonia herrerae TaxID=1293975 RepID=A0AA88V9T8_9ASTE|nr:hypothetical protein RJ639_018469 [Escallonia herrerae]
MFMDAISKSKIEVLLLLKKLRADTREIALAQIKEQPIPSIDFHSRRKCRTNPCLRRRLQQESAGSPEESQPGPKLRRDRDEIPVLGEGRMPLVPQRGGGRRVLPEARGVAAAVLGTLQLDSKVTVETFDIGVLLVTLADIMQEFSSSLLPFLSVK